jgi:hypothetical protein
MSITPEYALTLADKLAATPTKDVAQLIVDAFLKLDESYPYVAELRKRFTIAPTDSMNATGCNDFAQFYQRCMGFALGHIGYVTKGLGIASKCHICGAEFPSRNARFEHIRDSHPNDFAKRAALTPVNGHETWEAVKNKPAFDKTKCRYCGAQFPSNSKRATHEHEQHPEKFPGHTPGVGIKSICPFCKGEFLSRNALGDHVKRDHRKQLAEYVAALRAKGDATWRDTPEERTLLIYLKGNENGN